MGKIFKVSEVSEMLSVSEDDIRSCVSNGSLKAINCGSELLITDVALNEFLGVIPTNSQQGIDNTNDCTVTSLHSNNGKDDKIVVNITGSVSELKSGKNRFMASICWGRDENGKLLREGHRCATREEAEKLVAKMISKKSEELSQNTSIIDVGVNISISKNTMLSTYITYFLNLNITSATSRTRTGYSYSAKHIIKPIAEGGIGDVRLKDLNEDLVRKWSARLKGTLAQASIDKIFIVLRMALKYAYKKGYIDSNIMEDVKKPKSSKRTDKVVAYSEEEEKAILDAAKGYPEVYPILYLFSVTGMRPEELQALKWNNLDWDNKRIKIANAVVVEYDVEGTGRKKRSVIGPTKSENGVRTLPLTDNTIEVLREWKKYIDTNNEYIYARDGYMFPTREGSFMQYSGLRSKFVRFLASSGLNDKGYTFYRFRHTFCSKLVRANVQMAVVQEMMGDSSIDVILKNYTQIEESQTRNAINAIS